MDLLQRILECKDEEVESIIDEAIKDANEHAEKVERLGFRYYGKMRGVFKGFIPLDTRVHYSNYIGEEYGMQTTDFFYEFAHYIRKINIKSKTALVHALEYFINGYFVWPGKIDRGTIFDTQAWQSSTTDEEYFKALENNKIGDLKGKGAAECTERGALAEQILSLFGTESYYCMGCVNLGQRSEPHCFNIVKRQNDYALLDYSIPVATYNGDGTFKVWVPFVGAISNEEFLDFINNGTIKSFDEYYCIMNKQEKTGKERLYVVGKEEIKKDEQTNKQPTK